MAVRSLALPGARVQTLLVAGGAVAHLLHVAVGLDDLALDVAELRARAHELVVEQARLALEVGDLGQLREGLARVGDLRQPGVEGLEVEQLGLLSGFGFHGDTSGCCCSDREGPRVGAHCADVDVHPKGSGEGVSHGWQPHGLARPVARVDEVGRASARFLASLQRRVVTQVGGDIDIGSGRPHRVELVVARSPEDGHGLDHRIGRSSDTQAGSGSREGGIQGRCEVAQRHG